VFSLSAMPLKGRKGFAMDVCRARSFIVGIYLVVRVLSGQ